MRDMEMLPADRTAREAFIRDLYGIVAFYVANPDHPLPNSINLHHYVADAGIVETCSNTWGIGAKPYGELPQIDYHLPGVSRDVSLLVRVASEPGRPL